MKTATARKRTQSRALPWFGADTQVAEQYAALLADCKHVTIPFCGGLSVVAHLVETASEIVCNDRHTLAINFYNVIRDPATRAVLVNDLEATPFHESMLAESQQVCKTIGERGWIDMTPREVAFHYFITCWMGRSGKAGTKSEFNGGLAMRWDAGGGSSPLRFQTAVRSIQEVWGPICERCSFVCSDWREVLAKIKDDPKCGVYADPPWFVDGKDYQHSFSENDHEELAESLFRFRRAKVVLRYGNHPSVWDLYGGNRGGVCFRIEEVESRNQSNNEVAELCITNF